MKVVRAVPVPSFLSGGGNLGGGHARALKLSDHAVLNDQLFQLLSRGVPLVEALEVVAQTVAPTARPRIEMLASAA